LAAWLPNLLGRAAQSSPEAAPRRAKGAGLYGNGADRATLQAAANDRRVSQHKLALVVVESFEEMRADQVW
jgi:hypothetical protein